MKKTVSIFLALALVLTAAVFPGIFGASAEAPETAQTGNAADQIPDEMVTDDGRYQLAFVTDMGVLKDLSYNQGIFDGIKLFAEEKGMSYRFYETANGLEANDEDVYNAIVNAAENGAEVIVVSGSAHKSLLPMAAEDFPDVRFVTVDGEADDAHANMAGIVFKEEQSGYLAGYAAVMEGYTHLGFLGGGGGTNPSCCRYGYGFAQGADAAAKELGVKADLKFSWLYGSAFAASMELRSLAIEWFKNGTEVIFACGGSMFNSVSSASIAAGGRVIGVDIDQSFQSPTVVTSALKDVTNAVMWVLEKHADGTWEEIGGKTTALGAAEQATGLPTDSWRMEKFTVADYEKVFAAIAEDTVDLRNSVLENDGIASAEFEALTVDFVSEDPFAVVTGPGLDGWSVNVEETDIEKVPEIRQSFEEAVSGLLGVNYEPVAIVAGKFAAGNNCCILARAKAVTPDAAPYFALVMIHKGIAGDANTLDVIALENTGAAGGLIGGWAANEGSAFLADNPEAQTAFDTAMKDVTGVTYHPIALLSTQVVSGVNYNILATAEEEGATTLVQLTVYADLNGGASVTGAERLNLAPEA